jgi:hypothetical protein
MEMTFHPVTKGSEYVLDIGPELRHRSANPLISNQAKTITWEPDL